MSWEGWAKARPDGPWHQVDFVRQLGTEGPLRFSAHFWCLNRTLNVGDVLDYRCAPSPRCKAKSCQQPGDELAAVALREGKQ